MSALSRKFTNYYIVRTTTTTVVALQYRETFESLTLGNQATTRQCLRGQDPAGSALFSTALSWSVYYVHDKLVRALYRLGCSLLGLCGGTTYFTTGFSLCWVFGGALVGQRHITVLLCTVADWQKVISPSFRAFHSFYSKIVCLV